MIAYQYDDKGYFRGTIEDYGFLPHNATHTAPDARAGFIPRWSGSSWELVEDHKGEEGYLDGRAHTIQEYGPYPAGWSKDAPEKTAKERAQEDADRIKARLREIDSESVRPLRAMASGSQTAADTEKLAALDAEAATLRSRLQQSYNPPCGATAPVVGAVPHKFGIVMAELAGL